MFRYDRLEVRRLLQSYSVAENWNKITSEVKNVKTVSTFKRSYKITQRGTGSPT
jgi:hypothetical protein